MIAKIAGIGSIPYQIQNRKVNKKVIINTKNSIKKDINELGSIYVQSDNILLLKNLNDFQLGKNLDILI